MSGASLESRILSAARKLFLDPGYHATPTRALAAEAGTSESGIFRLFESKYHVLMAVYNDAWRQVNDRVTERLVPNDSPDPRTRIRLILEAIWKTYEADPVTAAFIIINTGNTDSLVVDRRTKAVISPENVAYIQRLNGLCEECVASQLVSPGLSAAALREGLLGISEGVLLGWYLADHAPGGYPPKVPLSAALAVAGQLLTPIVPERSPHRA